MKNFAVILAVLTGVFAVVSCDSTTVPKESGSEDILQGEGAYVKIMLPSFVSGNTRSISLEEAKQYTDYYQVTFKRTDTTVPEYFSADASSSDGYIELRIQAGQYDILLFAGNKTDTSNDMPLLLASAYKQGQDILLGEINIINLNLKLVEFVLDAPSLIHAGHDFEVTAGINFHNPLINYSDGIIMFRYNQWGEEDTWSGWTYLQSENSSYNVSTGAYTFADDFTAGTEYDGGVIYILPSPIKPFGNSDTDEWSIIDGSINGEITGCSRVFFAFKTPEVNINISWPEE